MIEIKHKDTGELLLLVEADTLAGQFLEGAKLAGADLAHQDLRKADLQRADLRAADLRGCDLTEAMMLGVIMNGANCCDAQMAAVDMTDCFAKGVNFRGCNLTRPNLRYAKLEESDFTAADLSTTEISAWPSWVAILCMPFCVAPTSVGLISHAVLAALPQWSESRRGQAHRRRSFRRPTR